MAAGTGLVEGGAGRAAAVHYTAKSWPGAGCEGVWNSTPQAWINHQSVCAFLIVSCGHLHPHLTMLAALFAVLCALTAPQCIKSAPPGLHPMFHPHSILSRYNLLREANEGYAKMVTLLNSAGGQPGAPGAAQLGPFLGEMRALIGFFSLDPNRWVPE